MSRPQSGIVPPPFFYNRIQSLEVLDIPMTSMTVGQFSVMIPGLGHQMVQADPAEELRVTIGFGFMFWTLAWHGKSPYQFQTFDELESGDRLIAEGEGDLWIHYSSTNPNLIKQLANKVHNNLASLVKVREDRCLLWNKPAESSPGTPDKIWIPKNEPEFANGTFMLQIEVEHSARYQKSLLPSLQKLVEQEELTDKIMIREMDLGQEEKKGTLLLIFHQHSGKLETLLEDWLDEDQPNLLWGDNGVTAARATRFFVPSLDVLTGLRQGGIRMNRFSQTRQWKD